MRLPAAALLCLLAACGGGESYRDTSVEMTTEASVDLARYAGRWYEIARFPNSFEEGCAGVTADYTLKDDGTVGVVNTAKAGSTARPGRRKGWRARCRPRMPS